MADARRAEFPDDNKPLYTPDADAQRQVVERIEQARQGETQDKRNKQAQTKADYVITLDRLPMGQHPFISYERLAKEWGVSRGPTAKGKVQNPERIDPYEAYVLCECLGVTLEWLRGWTDENAFGRYESADTVAALYGRLSNEDREMVSGLLKRLAGADTVAEVKHEQWVSNHKEWADRHKREVAKIYEDLRRTVAQLTKPFDAATAVASQIVANTATAQRAYDDLQSAADAAMQQMRDTFQRLADVTQAITGQYTDEEWQLMRETNERLKAQGVDTKGMTPQQLLDIARGDSVEMRASDKELEESNMSNCRPNLTE